MCSFAQKTHNYKMAVARSFKPFVEKGQITAQEVDFIATGALVASLENPRTRVLFEGDKS